MRSGVASGGVEEKRQNAFDDFIALARTSRDAVSRSPKQMAFAAAATAVCWWVAALTHAPNYSARQWRRCRCSI